MPLLSRGNTYIISSSFIQIISHALWVAKLESSQVVKNTGNKGLHLPPLKYRQEVKQKQQNPSYCGLRQNIKQTMQCTTYLQFFPESGSSCPEKMDAVL